MGVFKGIPVKNLPTRSLCSTRDQVGHCYDMETFEKRDGNSKAGEMGGQEVLQRLVDEHLGHDGGLGGSAGAQHGGSARGQQGTPSSALVVYGEQSAGGEEDLDDIIDVDLEETEIEMKAKWLVIARYYSGQRFNVKGLFAEMSTAWGLASSKHARHLGENKFLIIKRIITVLFLVVHGSIKAMPSASFRMMEFLVHRRF